MPVTNADSSHAILSAWIALEVLTAHPLRDASAIGEGPLPWQPRQAALDTPPQPYYQLILAAVDLEAAMERLTRIYPDTFLETRPARSKAIAAIVTLNSQGIPLETPAAAISSFAWGLHRALKGELESLDEWPAMEPVLQRQLTARLRNTQTRATPAPLTADNIENVRRWLISTLGLTPDLVDASSYVLPLDKRGRDGGAPEAPMIGSLFLNNLIEAARRVKSGTAPGNLRRYLGVERPAKRRDLLNDRRSLLHALRPALFSPARWPGPHRHPLVLLQQAAVNLALHELRDGGILAVNGPPGTGKTTLLRDIIAAVVTERARAMAAFEDPCAAFTASDREIRAGNGRLRPHAVHSSLKGFELLVASSNNRAVENISAELPELTAIAEDAPDLRYFKRTSDALQTSGKGGTWGLIAAVLGNANNRSRFKEIFWWDREAGMAAHLLRESMDRQAALARWKSARSAFLEILEKSEATLRRLESVRTLEDAEEEYLWSRQASHKAQQVLEQLGAHRPPSWQRFLPTRDAREWRRAARTARQSAHEAAQALRSATARRDMALSALPLPRESLREHLGPRLLDRAFFARQHSEYQREAPWLNDASHRTRDEVFIAAMRVHAAFIEAAAKPLRHNIGALMREFGGRATSRLTHNALYPDLWISLFMVVPVVSSTFASVERMLSGLPDEALGWLLVDEAGQAAPQSAVGALMKTRRAVIVGDPMQIEPVVSLPAALTDALCRRFHIDPERFNAPSASVQTLANEATAFMASLQGFHGERTVGVPLLIHRRCAEPMFGLSNAVAYNRLMIQARTHKASPIRAVLGPSRWLDIRGSVREKWCPEEGQCAIELLGLLAAAHLAPDLYLITPFTVVQDRLRSAILASDLLRGWIAEPTDWVRQRVGTVHVVQGREAEAVILVLGAPGSHQERARLWAGERPNLLNVAVSRAKEALYVIGNRDLWRTAGHFSELDAHMPAVDSPPLESVKLA